MMTDLNVSTVDLTAKQGCIWSMKPNVHFTGLISIFKAKFGSRSRAFLSSAFNRTSTQFAAVDERGDLTLFDFTKNSYNRVRIGGNPISNLHSGAGVAFNHHLNTLELLASFANNVVVVDIPSGNIKASLKGHNNTILKLQFSPTSSFALTCSSEVIYIWDTKNWEIVEKLLPGPGIISCSYNADGNNLLVSFRDNVIRVYQVDFWKETSRIDISNSLLGVRKPFTITSLAVSRDGHYVLVGTKSNNLLLWDIDNSILVRNISIREEWGDITTLSFIDDFHAAILCENGSLVVLNIFKSTPVILFMISYNSMTIDAFSVDKGNNLSLILSDGTIHIYDLNLAKHCDFEKSQMEGHIIKTEGDRILDHNTIKSGFKFINIDEVLNSSSSLFNSTNKNECDLINFCFKDTKGVGAKSTISYRKEPSWVGDYSLVFKTDGDDEAIFNILGNEKKLSNATAKRQVRREISSNLVRNANKFFNYGTEDEEKINKSSPQLGLQNSDIKLNRKRLETLMITYGEYPTKYRSYIWKYLLELPNNNFAYSSLIEKGLHSSFADLKELYPIQDKTLLQRLQRVLSALAHWSEVMGESPFLVSLVFPFVKFFGADEISSFETVVSIFHKWGRHWFQSFPNPPVSLLNEIENILGYHDPKLLKHFCDLNATSQDYIWKILRSLFSEILPREHWLILFDFLFTEFNQPNFIYFGVIAYLRIFRMSIFACSSRDALLSFLGHQNNLDVSKFISIIKTTFKSTPYQMIDRVKNPRRTIMDGLNDLETEDSNLFFPIPLGESYPKFSFYPNLVVNFQIQERERIAVENKEIASKRAMVEDMKRKTLEMAKEEEAMRLAAGKVQEAELKRIKEMERNAEQRVMEMKRLDELSRQRRLEQLSKTEETVFRNLRLRKEERELELKRIEAELIRKNAEADYLIESRKEEEALLNLELQANLRMAQAKESLSIEEETAFLRANIQAAEKKREIEDKILNNKWKLEDEERQARLKKAQERIIEQSIIKSRAQQEQQLKAQLEIAELEREVKTAGVERERKLRQVQEEENLKTLRSTEIARRSAALVAAEESKQWEIIMMHEREWREKQAAERMKLLEHEQNQLQKELIERDKLIKELEKEHRERDFKEKAMQLRLQEAGNTRKEEQELKRLILKIENERKKGKEIELEVIYKNEELKERVSYTKALRDAEEKAMKEERDKFQQLRFEMQNASKEKERAIIAAHKTSLLNTAKERESQIESAKEAYRKKTQMMEASLLAKEFNEKEIAEEDQIASPRFAQSSLEEDESLSSNFSGSSLDSLSGKIKAILHHSEGGSSSNAGDESSSNISELTAMAEAMIKRHQETEKTFSRRK